MPCPGWKYEDRPDRSAVLSSEVQSLLLELRSGNLPIPEAIADTRPIHKRLFSKLAPPDLPHFAGNYRGADLLCLRDYEVTVGSTQGYQAKNVSKAMSHLATIIQDSISDLDTIFGAQLADLQQLYALVSVSADLFTYFNIIHPYANGNGHIARFIVWAILGRYQYWVRDWPIEPRPADPPYSGLVRQSIAGDIQPLQKFILSRLIPSQA